MYTDYKALITELQQADTLAFIDKINQTIIRPVDVPLTSRIINHWHEKGVFPFKRESGKWREFCLVDYIWVLFVKRLRNLGVALPNVLKIKEQCFDVIRPVGIRFNVEVVPDPKTNHFTTKVRSMTQHEDAEQATAFEEREFRLFSLWLMMAIKKNQDVLVRILPDEANTTDFVFLTREETDTEEIVQDMAEEGGLFISIKSLLNEFYGSKHFNWEKIQKLEVDAEAKRVIAIMRERGLKEVVIKLDEKGKVTRVQTHKPEKRMTMTEFSNALMSQSFVDCRVVKQQGYDLIVSVKQNHRLKK